MGLELAEQFDWQLPDYILPHRGWHRTHRDVEERLRN